MPTEYIAPPLAALSNAMYDAAGIRMRSLPMNPAAVVKAREELEDAGS